MSDYFNLIAARIFYFNSGRIYFHQNKSIYLINVLHAVIGFMLAVKFLLAVSWEVNNSAGWLQLIQCGQLFLTACGHWYLIVRSHLDYSKFGLITVYCSRLLWRFIDIFCIPFIFACISCVFFIRIFITNVMNDKTSSSPSPLFFSSNRTPEVYLQVPP